MSIRFIYGRAGTGKSRFCIDEIKKKLQLDENRKLILIVPDQYTFTTENNVLREIGEAAFLKVQVLSFKKMASIVFEECGGRIKKIINESGKKMLIHKVLNLSLIHIRGCRRIERSCTRECSCYIRRRRNCTIIWHYKDPYVLYNQYHTTTT